MSQDLRKEYSSIKPGYHMNKTHWNTVTVDGTIPEDKLLFLIDLSYDLVYKSLKKSEQFALG
jgi:predicted DNA-binding protein (MmcQ/YjbR family)